MIEVTTETIRRAKLQSNRHHQLKVNRSLNRSEALPVAQPTM